MKNRTKKQHYISKSYLNNFCDVKEKNYNLCVYTHSRRQWRSSTPIREAFECDFQTLIDENGNKSDVLEKEICDAIEGPAMSTIKHIIEQKRLPAEPEKMGVLLSLMGLFAVRIPGIRQQLTDFGEDVSKKTLGLLLKDEATWNSQIDKAYSEGVLAAPRVSYAEALALHKKGNFEIEHDHMWVLKELFKMALIITDCLSGRNWMVVEASKGEFITSNKPVNPIWSECFPLHLQHKLSHFDPKRHALNPMVSCCYHAYNEPPDLMPNFVPGFGLLNTLITFPISRHMALIGSYGPLPAYRRADYCTVQAINWVTANSGASYVYSSRELCPLPWCRQFVPYLHLFYRYLVSRLIS